MDKTMLIGGILEAAPIRELRLAIILKVEEMILLALSGDSSVELFTIEEAEDGDTQFTVYPVGEPNLAITGMYYINSNEDVCVRRIEF